MSQLAGLGAPGRRFLRTRAVLAGGLVLGMSAAVTSASWVDNENATATFVASTFGIQSSVDGGVSYADSPSAPGATLTFATAAMLPGDTRSAAISIRAITGSLGGTIATQAATVTNNAGDVAPLLGGALRYRAYRFVTGSCGSATTPDASGAWIAGNATTTVVLTTVPTSPATLAAATSGAPGPAVSFCFQVMLPAGADNALQGKGATSTWRFVATSS